MIIEFEGGHYEISDETLKLIERYDLEEAIAGGKETGSTRMTKATILGLLLDEVDGIGQWNAARQRRFFEELIQTGYEI